MRLKRAGHVSCWVVGGPVIGALLAWHGPATAAEPDGVNAKDIQVIGRTLGFMENVPAGTVELGIVFLAGNDASVQEARAIADALGGGLPAGRVVLRPRLVPADALGGLNAIGALFVVPTAAAAMAATADAARRLGVVLISTDPHCVEAGLCVLAFRSEPTVEVYFSATAAENARVRFTPAFRMLVKQF